MAKKATFREGEQLFHLETEPSWFVFTGEGCCSAFVGPGFIQVDKLQRFKDTCYLAALYRQFKRPIRFADDNFPLTHWTPEGYACQVPGAEAIVRRKLRLK